MSQRLAVLLAPVETVAASTRHVHTFGALAIALLLGCVAMLAPAFAMLGLAALAAIALIKTDIARFDLSALLGPLLAAAVVGAFVGIAGAVGVIFVWRLFADTRWSVREAAHLAHIAGQPAQATWQARAHAWTTPLFGLSLVAYTAPHMVAGLPLDLPHAPLWVPLAAGGVAALAVLDWALRRGAEWRLGDLAPAPAAHMLTHHIIFMVAFGLGLDVSAGIVALAAWRLAHAARQPSFTAVP